MCVCERVYFVLGEPYLDDVRLGNLTESLY